MYKKIILAGVLLTLFFIFISVPLAAQAALIDPNADAYQYGSYSLNDIMGIVIGASSWILGIVGSLALLMFIYGGFMFLISAGSSDKIGQAQKILVAAVVGLVIVFASYMIISFVAQAIGVTWQGGKIIPASSTNKSGTSVSTNDCAAIYGKEGFSCRLEAGAGFCIANHCGSGANVCCHESCESLYGTNGYKCIDTSKTAFESCQPGGSNLCAGGANTMCCIPK